jgi:hypothetical protein
MRKLVGAGAAAAAAFFALASTVSAEADVLYGTTAFPHDLTLQSSDQVHELIMPNATLYAQHMDQCLPWQEALDGTRFPEWLENDLADILKRKRPGQILYVAMTPTMNDRRSMAAPCGSEENEEGTMPSVLDGASFDEPEVETAYVNYVRRIIDTLHPEYVNIGIEISELALQYPDEWPPFETLFRRTVDALHKSHPHVKVGLEVTLQAVMKPEVSALVKPAAEYGDYIGISFYPYGGAFGEIFGAPALPAPPEQWREPFRFLRDWTSKPIAIAETGYTSVDVRVQVGDGIDFPGNPELQTAFLEDLIDEAVHERYLFVVWFVPVDYTKLLEKLGAMGAGAEWMKIWVHAGLFDAELRPKPVFEVWARWRDQAAILASPRRF